MKSIHILFALSCLLIINACKEEDNKRVATTAVNSDARFEALPINQIQYIGSHNSYRLRTTDKLFDFAQKLKPILSPLGLNPDEWDYTHLPITEQLDLGLRTFELDIYNDPSGGKFYNRAGNALVGLPVASGIDALKKPGMKIIHIPDMDYNTHYYTFVDALAGIRNWSIQHPSHLPIFIMVELKDFSIGNVLPFFAKALPFDESAMNKVDEEINGVFDRTNLLFTPDDLRKSYPNIKTALETEGWPTVKAMRGKIIIIAYHNDAYLTNHPNLENRKMFMYVNEDSPNAAFIIKDGSQDSYDDIQRLVNQGYIVRTRADAGTDEARTEDYTNMNAAFTSGAQLISTDYYVPDFRAGANGWSYYKVSFDGNTFNRTNVLNTSTDIAGQYIMP
ncbi:MAG: Ca2+-dependent phosphoinositide-specific phospholipase C [Chitinophagales bacterium]